MKSEATPNSAKPALQAIFVAEESYFKREGDIAAGQVAIYSHIGSHVRQEDALYFGDSVTNNTLILAAADGLGRYNGGAQAAELCVEALHETLMKFDGNFDPDKLAEYIRLKMRKNPIIMHDEAYAGGACMVIARINLDTNVVEFFSMGDTAGYVESSYGELAFEIEADKKTKTSSGVTKALSPQLPGLKFTYSGKYQLRPGDKVHCMTDGVEVERIIHDSNKIGFTHALSHYFELIERAKEIGILDQDNASIVSVQLAPK